MVARMGLEPSSRLSQVETVLWRGRPRTAWYVVRLWWPAAPLAAVVLAFGAGWEWLALRAHYLVAYPLGGTLFLALGVYGLALRPLLLLRVARRMVYTVTDRRVVWEWGPKHGCVARERARSVSDQRESATSVGDERARERSAGDGRESATSTAAARRTVEFRLDTLPPWFVVSRRRGTDLVFFGEPSRDSSWGLWRLTELRPWFVCLDQEAAAGAAAALRVAAAPAAASAQLSR
jgi:hypothetical protein